MEGGRERAREEVAAWKKARWSSYWEKNTKWNVGQSPSHSSLSPLSSFPQICRSLSSLSLLRSDDSAFDRNNFHSSFTSYTILRLEFSPVIFPHLRNTILLFFFYFYFTCATISRLFIFWIVRLYHNLQLHNWKVDNKRQCFSTIGGRKKEKQTGSHRHNIHPCPLFFCCDFFGALLWTPRFVHFIGPSSFLKFFPPPSSANCDLTASIDCLQIWLCPVVSFLLCKQYHALNCPLR